MGDFFDVPAGYRDADIETAELEAAGRAEAVRRKRGECSHSWTGPKPDAAPHFVCNHCGFTWPNRDAVDEHWRECRAGDCSCTPMAVQS